MRIEYETRGLIRFRKMRIQFGTILSILIGKWINENTVWTDSQGCGADEILYAARTALFNKTNRVIEKL